MALRCLTLWLTLMTGGSALAVPVYPDSNYLFGGSGPDGPAGQLLRMTLSDGSTYTASTRDSPIGLEPYAENFGWWSSKLGHIAGNYNYFSGYNGVFNSTNHNFFLFDLSGVHKPVTSATLLLTAYAASSPFNPMRFDLHDVSTAPADLLQSSASNPNQEIFDDLASGTRYGTLAIYSYPDYYTQLSIQLNEIAVDHINGRQSRYFSIGGATHLIPEPGSISLVSLGFFCLVFVHITRALGLKFHSPDTRLR